jgi:hypothetical protein
MYRNNTRLDWANFYVSFLTLLAVVAYTAITYCLLRDQRKEFESDNRPWISVIAASPITPLTFDERGGHLTIQLVLRNIGHLPAQFVWADAEFFTRGLDAGPFVMRHKEFCSELRKRNMSSDETSGFTLFPQIEPVPRNVPLIMKPEEVAKLLTPTEITSTMIGGCVDYVDPLSGLHRQTPFIYEVVKLDPADHDSMNAINPAEGQFALGTFGLAVHPALSGNAD